MSMQIANVTGLSHMLNAYWLLIGYHDFCVGDTSHGM